MDIIDQLPADLKTKVTEDLQSQRYGDFEEIVHAALHTFYDQAEITDEGIEEVFGQTIRDFEAGKIKPSGTLDELNSRMRSIINNG